VPFRLCKEEKRFAKPLKIGKRIGRFAKNGVKELILIAQDLTYYGLDIYKKRALGELLEVKLGIEWIRLHYAFLLVFQWMY
jgi:ribosomal protein S12 methylthiotransferase